MSSNANLSSKEEKKFKAYITEIRKMEEEKQAISDDISETYAALKADGFDVQMARKAIAELKQKEKNPDKFDEAQAKLDAYRLALGLI